MPGPPLLRPATPRDETFLRAVYASSREQELAPLTWSAAEKDAFLRQQYDRQEQHYRNAYQGAEWSVIVLDGRDAGRLILHRGEAAFEIMDIALLSEWRGCGAGTALVQRIMTEAAGAGVPVRLWVEHFNPAQRLYQRLGFVHTSDHGPHREYIWRPGQAKMAS